MRRAAASVVLSFGLVFAAEPAAPGSPAPILKRWVDAAGGEKALKRVKSATYRASSTSEGIGTSVEVGIARDQLRRVTTQQGDVQEEVVNGTTAWLRDWNGHVRDVVARDRADQRTDALIEALLYAGAIADTGAMNPTLVAKDEAHPKTTVRFAPKDAAPFDVEIDDATGLPAKLTRSYFGDDVIVEPSDWREVSGVKVPFKVAFGGGESRDRDTAILQEYVPSRKLLASAPARPKDGPRDVFFANGHAALAIPFNFENDHLMVDVRVNGHEPMWFMLDTGAEQSFINKTHMEEFGLTPFGVSSAEGGGKRKNSPAGAGSMYSHAAAPDIRSRAQDHGRKRPGGGR